MTTCREYFDTHQIDGEAVLDCDEFGAQVLWLHQRRDGTICLDDCGCCPAVDVTNDDVDKLTREWKEAAA